MTETLEQQLANAHAERDEWRTEALDTSKKLGEAVNTLTVATAAVVNGAAPAKPAPAPPPPTPAAPPLPPRPASMSAFLTLPAHEQKIVAAAYGGRDALMETLDAEFHARNRIASAGRGGASSHRITTFGESRPLTVAEAQDKARADLAGFQAMAPKPFFKGTPAAATAESLAAAMTASAHAGARPAPAPAPAPKALHRGAARR
jgi:hypothetical protein